MPMPKYYHYYKPFLLTLEDGAVHALKEVKARSIEELHLSEEDLLVRVPSGVQTTVDNRISWAGTHLKKAGLIVSPKRAYFQITDEGLRLLHSGIEITDRYLIEHNADYAAFRKVSSGATSASGTLPAAADSSEAQEEHSETPQETLSRMLQLMNDQLAEDLLTEVMNQTPVFFEKLVVDLLKNMGYGEGFVTKSRGDGGIDGIVHEDALGFNLIYIQAKRWDPSSTISRPDIQKFAGAMMGPPRIDKGLFITTAKFSDSARKYADAQHIILVDGQRLAQLMIEYDVGVSVQKTFSLKRIDSDYFAED